MNRRHFLELLGATAAVVAIGDRLVVSMPPLTNPKGKFGNFDIESDGTLSRDGQTKWPLYGADGGLSHKMISYKLHRGVEVEAVCA